MRLTTISFRNFTHRKLRTFLCIFAVATAVCFVVAVGATSSRYAAIMSEMGMFFRDEIVVVERNAIVIQGFPIGGTISQSAVDNIAGLNGVEKVTPMLFNLEFKLGEVSNIIPNNVTIGLPIAEWQQIINPTYLRPGGTLPSQNSTDMIIIGHSIADQYGITTGSKMLFKGRELSVCGIIESPFALLGRSIIMSLETAQEVLKYPMRISMAIVETKPNASQEALASEIDKEIANVMALTENERNDLTKPIVDIIENWNWAIQGIVLLLSMILVTIVGMINVSERRREFATLDAIGAPLNCLIRIVLLETTLIGVVGAIIGIAFGSVAAAVLASLYTSVPVSQFFSGIFLIVPPLYMLELFVAVVIVCCIGGIIPAMNAVRNRIAEVLRAEY